MNAKIISVSENKSIQSNLKKINDEIENGKIEFQEEYEDIHMNIEMILKKKIGSLSGKIHTGKSRNDQVVTDTKLWVKEKLKNLSKKISRLQTIITIRLKKYRCDNARFYTFTKCSTNFVCTLFNEFF